MSSAPPTTASTALHRDFVALKRGLKADGLFQVSSVRLWVEIAAYFLLFPLCYFISYSHLAAALALLTVLNIHLAWWLHDAGHDAYFSSRNRAKFWIEALSVIFMGMPQIDYHFTTHRKHHGPTNVLGKDPALATGPIIWHEAMLERSNSSLLKVQAYLWFLVVLPFTHVFISVEGIKFSVQSRRWIPISALAARWALFIFAFKLPPLILLHPMLIAAYVGYVASLNHFHMPILKRMPASFPANVFHVTQNISHPGRFATWLLGGLNFHIEHHLFPEMPSRNYQKIAPQVRAFARRHQLPYTESSLLSATTYLTRKISDPLRPRKLRSASRRNA